jgi:hypothetical protein
MAEINTPVLRNVFKKTNLDEQILSLRKNSIFARKSSINARKVLTRKTLVSAKAQQTEKRINFLFETRNRRRRREELLEANSTKSGYVSGTVKNALDRGKGFLGKIMDSLGFLLLGWLVNQLPRILVFIDTLKFRITNIIDAGKSMIKNIGNIINGIGGVVSQATQNIMNFDFQDFNDPNGKFQSKIKELDDNIKSLGSDFEDAKANILNITTPPTEEERRQKEEQPGQATRPSTPGEYYGPGGDPSGSGAGQAQQGTRPQQPTPTPTPAPTPTPTPAPTTSYRSKLQPIHIQALNKISEYESAAAGNYNAMNQGTVNDAAGRRPYSGPSRRGIGKDLTNMTIAEILQSQDKRLGNNQGFIHAAGRYQFLKGTLQIVVKQSGISDKVKFSPDVQDYLAAVLLTMPGGGLSHWTADRRTGLLRDQAGMDLINRASRTPLKNVSSPTASPVAPQAPQRRFGDKAVLNGKPVRWGGKNYGWQSPESFATISRPQQPTSQPPFRQPIRQGGLNLIPQRLSDPGGFIQGGSGSRRGPDGTTETHYATHFHIDGPRNLTNKQRKEIREVAFHAIKAMFARGSSVHLGSSRQDLRKGISDSTLRRALLIEQNAHAQRSSPAIDIQENNPNIQRTFPSQPGSKTTFPFAIGKVYMRGGYGREAMILGTDQISVSHGAPGSKESPVSVRQRNNRASIQQSTASGMTIAMVPVPVENKVYVPTPSSGGTNFAGSNRVDPLNSIRNINSMYT